MKIHHLNCGSLCPKISSLELVCHCLLIETDSGLVLIDSGLGLVDITNPDERLGKSFNLMGPLLLKEETAFEQIKKLGFDPQDVQHIVLTHLDPDHAGGLVDFPQANVHVFEGEYKAAISQLKLLEKQRYKSIQWAHHPKWQIYPEVGEQWFGFNCVRELRGLPSEILMVPLIGHTMGHCGIAINTGSHWLLHAGDAYFHHDEIYGEKRECPSLLNWFQSLFQLNGSQRMFNQYRLRDLKQRQGDSLHILCSHDKSEFDQFSKLV